MDVPCIKKHLFLTGEKRIGKSTLIRLLLSGQKKPVGGFYTVRTDAGSEGKYAVYLLQVLPDGTAETPSEKNRLFFCPSSVSEKQTEDFPLRRRQRFETLGIAALEKAGQDAVSLILMDELGPNEEEAAAFQEAVFRTLDGEIPVLGVLQRAESDFLAAIAARPDVCVMEVTRENRDIWKEAIEKRHEKETGCDMDGKTMECYNKIRMCIADL